MQDNERPQPLAPGAKVGASVRYFLQRFPVWRHQEILARLEQAAIRESDLVVLRDIRAYRKKQLDPKT